VAKPFTTRPRLNLQRVNRRPSPDEGYQLAVRTFSVVIIGFGLVMLVLTLARGGGPLAVGFLFGLLFIALGAGRLYLSMKG
jgi:hypothetical protein